jgi:NAD(P)-dependent dehydrogenase (short-subunit alcohol dehydrogenase family)
MVNLSTPRPALVVITGVSRGLGRAMVHEFDHCGLRVAGCARSREAIESLGLRYPEHDFQIVDVSEDRQVRNWAAQVTERYGAPKIVINNAAVLNVRETLWHLNDEEFSQVLDINVKGVVNVLRHFIPTMMVRKDGFIINFISRWGKHVEERLTPYCASKWAVVALTRALAQELASTGIAVIGLNPGVVRTEMLKRYLGNTEELGSYPSSDEWAQIAVPLMLSFTIKDAGKTYSVSPQHRNIISGIA